MSLGKKEPPDLLYALFGADGGLDRDAMRRHVDVRVVAGANYT